jgi:hydroxymethylbilane synthase
MHTTVKMDKRKNSCSFLNVALYCILYLIVSSSSSVVVEVTSLSTTATTTTPKIIRIGTRPSPLAKIQAKAVAKALKNILTKKSNCEVEIQIIDILTTGDQSQASSSSSSSSPSPSVVQAQPLAVQSVDFTGALDSALLHNEIDIAVHSLKDIPPSTRWCHRHGHRIEIASCLKREDPLDVLVVSMVTTATNTVSHFNSESKASNPPNYAPGEGLDLCIQNLPRNARVGTSSVRRQAQLLSMRKDLELINLRGNVGARLKALEDGTVDALLLAAAGLNRLLSNDGGGAEAGARKKNQMASNVCWRDIPSEDILSGSCQGIVATTCRSLDSTTLNLLREIDHHDSSIAAAAERAFLDGLDSFRPTLYEGSTEWIGRPPLAALMTKRGLDDDAIEKWDSGWTFRGLLARPDGLTVIKTLKTTHGALSIDDARALGKEQAEKLLLEAGPDFYR